MRCPHCRGEIPTASRFCGVCGGNVTIPPTRDAHGAHSATDLGDTSASLFDLPVSNGAKLARVLMIVVLNLALVGGGVALIIEYLHKRAQATTSQAPSRGDSTLGVSESDEAEVDVPVAVVPTRSKTSTERTTKKAKVLARPSGISNPKAKSPASKPSPSPMEVAPKIDASPPLSDASPPVATEEVAVLSEEEEVARVRFLAGQIGLVVRRHQGPLKRCYQRASKAGTAAQPVEGRVSLRFSLQPSGRATKVEVISNSLGAPVVAQCLVGLVEGWEFPSSGSEALEFVWPFEFMAPE